MFLLYNGRGPVGHFGVNPAVPDPVGAPAGGGQRHGELTDCSGRVHGCEALRLLRALVAGTLQFGSCYSSRKSIGETDGALITFFAQGLPDSIRRHLPNKWEGCQKRATVTIG